MDEETFNLHIAAICRYIARYTEEISKSASAGVTALSTSDKIRLGSYIADIRIYIDWVWALQEDDDGGFLDLPESHPTSMIVPLIDPVGEMENNALIDIIVYLKTLYVEAMSAQSSRLGAGLIGHDYLRMSAILDTIDSYIETFVAATSPQDFPESSPRKAMPTSGKTGVRKK